MARGATMTTTEVITTIVLSVMGLITIGLAIYAGYLLVTDNDN